MGRAPCCDKANVKKGPWSPEEDAKLKEYIDKYGTGGNWISLPQKAGLRRCGKSCRLRWLNYLRPNIKHGEFSDEEDRIICNLFANIGSRWSIIAAQLPGRTDNDIKNYWNTKLKKKLMGISFHSSHVKAHSFSNTFQSILQPSSTSSSSPSSYNISQTRSSFTNLEPNPSFSPSLMISNCSINAASFLHQLPQAETFARPMQHSQVKDHILMFGSEAAASCSSSDGSQGRDRDHETGLQNYYYNGVDQGSQKLMPSENKQKLYGNGIMWEDHQMHIQAPLDYGLEEIKQLISSTGSCNNFLFDENKTEEKVMMYY